MSKKNLLLLVFCLFINHLQAQKLTWGELNKSDKRSYNPTNLLGKSKGNYFLIMREKKTLYLQMYSNTSLKLEKEVKLEQKLGKEELDYQFSYMIGSNIYSCYAFFDKKTKESKYYLMTYKTNLEAVGALREVATVKSVSKRQEGYLSFSISGDSSKIALIAVDNVEDEEKQKFTVFLYDNEMKKISTKNIEVPYVDELFDVYSAEIDNEGNFYVFGKLYKEKVREKRKGVVNYTFEVAVFGQDGGKSQKTITLGESLYMKDMNITIDKQNMVRIVGFYGEKSKNDVAKGVFSMTFDKDMNISKKSQKPFSTEFIQSFNKVRKKNADALDQFDIKEIINNNDGTVVVLAERSYIVTRTTRDSRGNISTTYVFYDQDILWIKLTDTFEVGQIKQIAKNQIGNSPILHSFVSYHNGDGVIYLLFNDHVENTEISGNEDKIMREGKAALFSVKIDNDGKMVKKLLYERHPDKFFLLPRFSSQVNDKEVLLFTMRGKEYLFGKATF